jgi:nucleoside-diphosphate-sugar epimerase
LARTVVVTGANGFVGVPLCSLLIRSGADVRAVVRRHSVELAELAELAGLAVLADPATDQSIDPVNRGRLRQVVVGDLGPDTDWSAALVDAEAVVHLAARVHVPGVSGRDDGERFRAINVEATLRLAEAAARSRVRRLVFVSSAKAGNGNEHGASDPYSGSKAEAERLLGEASRHPGLECVIVRPPLVYGPRVKANFLRLMHLVDSGLPLPLASVANHRSLLFVGNLADALYTCIGHPQAAGRTFSVSDGEDVSTPELVRRIARALGRPARLFPFPVALLRAAGGLAGQRQAVDRLTGDLTIDASPIRAALDWRAPFSMESGLAETAAWYRARLVRGAEPRP